jgi:hypothetical protein
MKVGAMTTLWNAIRRRRVLALVIGGVLVAGLGTSAALVGREFSTPDQPANAANAMNKAEADKTEANGAGANKTGASPKFKPAGFTVFRSDQAGFQLAYPANWTKLSPKDPSVLLLLSQGTQDSLLVRANELQEAVGPQQLAAARQVTDKLVMSNKTISMVTDPKQIELGGLPGFFYFYNFKDAATGQEGAHSHFFLFNGKTMISIVFQALPKEHFPESAKTFDQIAASFLALKK